MKETTLDTGCPGRLQVSTADRVGAWLYTGAPGRLVSFSIDLGLTLAALAVWSRRRLWSRVRSAP